jgi:hypothetical protein
MCASLQLGHSRDKDLSYARAQRHEPVFAEKMATADVLLVTHRRDCSLPQSMRACQKKGFGSGASSARIRRRLARKRALEAGDSRCDSRPINEAAAIFGEQESLMKSLI